MNRRQEREQAFIVVFEKQFSPELTFTEVYDTAVETEIITATDFTKKLALLVSDKCEEIDSKIQKYSISWDKNRISKVSLAILRLAISEMLYLDDIPVSVSINEAVELSKKFASPKDANFVNGLLGSVAKEIKNGPEKDTISDIVIDAINDVMQETKNETVQDTESETVQDTESKTVQDTESKTVQDTESEVVQDPESETVQDTENDTEQDTESETVQDAESEAVQDTESKTKQDTENETEQDAESEIKQD